MSKKVIKISLLLLIISIFVAKTPNTFAANSVFKVNVREVLSVSITAPNEWATGDIDEFLRNTINVKVASNNPQGFTVGMNTSKNDTNLSHTIRSSIKLPTLTSNYTCENAECESFPANYWGYSLDDANNTGTYKPLVNITAAPITILSSTGAASKSGDVYFGAKSDISQASGTYAGTVIISVISFTNGDDLEEEDAVHVDPARPGSNDSTAEYNSSSNTTSYTYTTDNGNTTTTTTQASDGDNTNTYDGYIPPQGAKETNSYDVHGGSIVANVLAAVASVSASIGILFFIIAKREDKEDESE